MGCNPLQAPNGYIVLTNIVSRNEQYHMLLQEKRDDNSDFSGKLKQSLLDEFRVNLVNIWAKSCNILIGEMVPRYVRKNALNEMYNLLNQILPEVATKLRTCVANAGGLGMSCALIIKEAVNRNPTFNWTIINRIFSNEMIAAQQAIEAVNADPYVGLSERNAFPASGYRSLAYIAKRLLIDVNGIATLEHKKYSMRNVNTIFLYTVLKRL